MKKLITIALFALLSTSCTRSPRPFVWPWDLPTADSDSIDIPEDAEATKLCVQGWTEGVGENEGGREWEYRCIDLDILRNQLFPETPQ